MKTRETGKERWGREMEKVEDDDGNTRTERKRKKRDKRIMRPNDMREHEITTGNA